MSKQTNRQRVAVEANFTSEEEYFLFEEKSETRHELINGNLYEISVSIFHNDIVGNLYSLFRMLLKGSNYKIAFENFKYRTPDKTFLYPDLMIFERNDASKFFSEKPVLIAEVLSPSTHKFDLIDKFIQYQKAGTLQYYLCVEPEQKLVIFYFKTKEGEWMTESFTNENDETSLPHLFISIFLKNIYQSF